MKSITPCLWLNNNAEEAVDLYTSVFPNSEKGTVVPYSEAGAKASGMRAGEIMTIDFKLNGQPFVALNGGPMFKFTEAVSFMVSCENQEEVDMFWEKLTANGGSPGVCGWLKDKFGLSWQIIPTALYELASGGDAEKSQRVMEAMLKMNKIDIEELRRAAEGDQ